MAIYKRHLGRSTMQCNATQCNAMQCNAMQCNAMECNAMQCNAIQYNTGLFMMISKQIQQAARFIFVFALS